MIDFSLLPRRNKTYAGANGSKIAVMYEDELYMLKFPGIARKNKDIIRRCLRSGRRKF